MISAKTATDPHQLIVSLQNIQDSLITCPSVVTFYPSINDEIRSLINDCHKTLKNSSNVLRKLQQNVQRCLAQRNYDELIQVIETYGNNYPIAVVAQRAVTVVNKILPYCDGDLLDYIMDRCECLQVLTTDYNDILLLTLPMVKVYIKNLELIYSSLHTGSPDIEATRLYFESGKHLEELDMHKINRLIKLQEVAPNFVQRQSQGLL